MSKAKARQPGKTHPAMPSEPRIVKPELNIEQWALFIPGQTRGQGNKTRMLERAETLPDGNTVTDTVTVGYSQHGTLTAKDQRVFYALVLNWHEKGRPRAACGYSAYRLAQLLRVEDSGKHLYDITESLRRLHSVTISFKRCFFDAENQRVYKDEEPLHLLSELKIRLREQLAGGKYEPLGSEGSFAFHPRILKNLLSNYTRPILFDTVLSFKDDTAQLLYALVDRQIVGKAAFVKVTADLFRELGIAGGDYHKPSARKRRLEPALNKLTGKPLSSGGFIGRAELSLTRDESDYKITVARVARAKSDKPAPPALAAAPTEADGALLEQLRALGVTRKKAAQLVREQRAATERELAAWPWRDHAAIKDPPGWLIRAIEQGDYAPPPPAAQHQAARQAAARQAAAARQGREAVEAQHRPRYVAAYLQPLRDTLAQTQPAAAALYAERCAHWDKTFPERAAAEVAAWKLADLETLAAEYPAFGLLTFAQWLAHEQPAAYATLQSPLVANASLT